MARSKVFKHEERVAYLFLAPGIIFFLLFIAFPILFSAVLAFSEWNLFQGITGLEFVGLENFKQLFADRQFFSALKNNLLYVIFDVPITLGASLVLSYIIKERVFGSKVLRAVFFIPYVIHIVALAHVFKMFFNTNGLLNNALLGLGLADEPLRWLSRSDLLIYPLVALGVIGKMGYSMVVYLAALQNVPRELYEASEIDGAGGLKRFLKITLPMTSPTIFFLAMTMTIQAFQLYASVKVLAQSSMTTTFSVLVYELYTQGFQFYKFGYASAIAWVLFAIIMIVTAFQLWGEKKWVHYS